jgi:hypothetical protein
VISVFPTSGGASERLPLPDKQNLFAESFRHGLAAMLFINEPIEIGANLLLKCDVSACCAHG